MMVKKKGGARPLAYAKQVSAQGDGGARRKNGVGIVKERGEAHSSERKGFDRNAGRTTKKNVEEELTEIVRNRQDII